VAAALVLAGSLLSGRALAAPMPAAVPDLTWQERSSGDLTAPGRAWSFGAMTTLGDGASALAHGAADPFDEKEPLKADTWRYDPDAGWQAQCGTPIPGADHPCGPAPRVAPGMATAAGGTILFGGALDTDEAVPTAETWRFDETTRRWEQVCDDTTCGPEPVVRPALAGNGSVALLVGGRDRVGAVRTDTWIFDGTRWEPVCGPTMPTACPFEPRAGAALAWDGTRFVMFGGRAKATTLADTWTFALETGTWSLHCGVGPPACGPAERELATMTGWVSSDGSVDGALLASGAILDSPERWYRDAWRFDGEGWTPVAVPWDDAPWDATGTGLPPDPVSARAAALPGACRTVLLGTREGTDRRAPRLVNDTRELLRSVEGPGWCGTGTPPTTPPPTTTPPTTPPTTTPPPTGAPPPTTPTVAGAGATRTAVTTALARTGPPEAGIQAVIGAGLVAGGLGLLIADRRRLRAAARR
jgi:hypothetical protein